MKMCITALLFLAACSSTPKRECASAEDTACAPSNKSQAKPNALANFFYGIGDALKTNERREPNAAPEGKTPLIYDDPKGAEPIPRLSPELF